MNHLHRGIGLALIIACCGAAQTVHGGGHALIAPTAEGSPLQGNATLTPGADGLLVAVHVTGAPPGAHGIHIHEQGDCANQGNAAGGHFNPTQAPHGLLAKDGHAHAHAGDMGNILIREDGTGTLEVTLPGVTLADVAGRALILHEKADDFGQPTGNAGGRIGCGVIEGA